MLRLLFGFVTVVAKSLFGLICWILMWIPYGAASISRRAIQVRRYIEATTHPYHRLDALHRPNAYAVITGATDGIGYAFARFLYLRGWNLLIIGRSDVKLDKCRKELRDAYRTMIKSSKTVMTTMPLSDMMSSVTATVKDDLPDLKTFVMDFESASLLDYNVLNAQLVDLKDVAMLINNVGMNTETAQHFQDIQPHLMKDMLTVNQYAAMQLTHMLLQQRRSDSVSGESAEKHIQRVEKILYPCLILNVSSASSLLPTCPSMSVYAATKAFLNTWSDALRAELCCLAHRRRHASPSKPNEEEDGHDEREFMHYAKHQCVDAMTRVETLTPFFVTTKLSGVQQATWSSPSAATYVASALRHINVFDSWTGYWPHSVLRFVLTHLVPTPKLMPYIDRMLHTIKPPIASNITRAKDDGDVPSLAKAMHMH